VEENRLKRCLKGGGGGNRHSGGGGGFVLMSQGVSRTNEEEEETLNPLLHFRNILCVVLCMIVCRHHSMAIRSLVYVVSGGKSEEDVDGGG
jgi:hypothetical protein